MSIKRPVASKKRERKPRGGQRALLHPAPVSVMVVNPSKSGSGPQPPAVFDPYLLLTRINGGKTRHQYQANATVFAQGDAADAVFYIESGKVKLTVVSKQGKEAVVAILPEASFFGEGCLAGQPLRMASASTIDRSTIIRVEKRLMLEELHQEPDFAGRFLAFVLSGTFAWKLTSWIISLTPARSGLPGFFCF